jgi:hypothetical protein
MIFNTDYQHSDPYGFTENKILVLVGVSTPSNLSAFTFLTIYLEKAILIITLVL